MHIWIHHLQRPYHLSYWAWFTNELRRLKVFPIQIKNRHLDRCCATKMDVWPLQRKLRGPDISEYQRTESRCVPNNTFAVIRLEKLMFLMSAVRSPCGSRPYGRRFIHFRDCRTSIGRQWKSLLQIIMSVMPVESIVNERKYSGSPRSEDLSSSALSRLGCSHFSTKVITRLYSGSNLIRFNIIVDYIACFKLRHNFLVSICDCWKKQSRIIIIDKRYRIVTVFV